ncbi:hypothetical protein BDV59DRAFT_188996 [Aspergillus ambiguus]|uniref:uncharacterized protein n=1 Tax=Aspergillus ambiguus TaxID=176160 RepID=UPI003CCD27B6
MDDRPDGSCPTNPPLSTTERTVFDTWGCVIYGYPSTGGVLRKDADLVDMRFLSLSRSYVRPTPTLRSTNAVRTLLSSMKVQSSSNAASSLRLWVRSIPRVSWTP